MKRGLKCLLVSDSWINLSLGMLGPIYAIFVQEIGGDILDASSAYFAYMFTAGVVMYLIGRWENRVKHKEKLVVIGYALTSLGCISYLFVVNQPTLLITQVILGLGMAVLDPAFDSVYSHYVTRTHEASDWGTWEALNYMVTAIASLIGGFLAQYFGFKTLFIIMSVISVLSVVNGLRLLRNKKELDRC